MARISKRTGQSVVLLTISFTAITGMFGLVVDMGWAYYRQQAAAAAAQSAALGAMQAALQSGGAGLSCSTMGCQAPTACPNPIPASPNAMEHGCLYAKDNGFAVTTGGKQNVTMESGSGTPNTANITNSTYWITARVSESIPQMFSAVLGKPTANVAARATAAVLTNSNTCIYVMDPTASGALTLSGTPSLVSTCGVYVNSSSPSALNGNGTPILQASSIDVVGGSNYSGTISPAPTTGAGRKSDPLSYLSAPDLSSLPVQASSQVNINGWSITTLQPGIYKGGISVGNGTAIFAPGTYVIEGGGISTQNSNSTITGTGVFIYNTCSNIPGACGSTSDYAGIDIKATSTVSLTAPITGTYSGILLMEDRSIPAGAYSDNFGGGSAAAYVGTIYAPRSDVTFYGNAALTAYTILVANQLSMVGTTSINNNYTSLVTGNPLKTIVLVE